MAKVNGAIVKKVELYGANNDGDVRRYTVADNTAISKGILLKLTDARTASASTGSASNALAAAGISNAEKKVNDGSTSLGAWTNGIFEISASGAITAGNAVIFVADNYVGVAPGTVGGASGAIVAGYALETAADLEVINVRVKL